MHFGRKGLIGGAGYKERDYSDVLCAIKFPKLYASSYVFLRIIGGEGKLDAFKGG